MARKKKKPKILDPHQHNLSEESISEKATWVMNRLRWAGFLAYLVGGAVRDILLEKQPKDFDVATNATPKQIKELFINCKIIGRRFQIVHIFFRDGSVLEISTFRALRQKKRKGVMLKKDNHFGRPEEDAFRRDITVNGLFYDSETSQIIDYLGGIDDLENRIVRSVGEPNEHFREDPIRMIRVIRHAARHSMTIEENTWKALRKQAKQIFVCSPERTLLEFTKELAGGSAASSIKLMFDSGFLHGWVSDWFQWLQKYEKHSLGNYSFGPFVNQDWGITEAVWKNLQALDQQMKQEEQLDEVVLYAALFMPVLWARFLRANPAKKLYGKTWQVAFEKYLLPMIRPLKLWKYQKTELNDLIHVYWKLHLFQKEHHLQKKVLRSKYLQAAIDLLKIELTAHKKRIPNWISQLENESKNK